jgi:cellulose synthase/poly-beta-1,6-N-acetylglucosamine synthase-like glycosyltransferase
MKTRILVFSHNDERTIAGCLNSILIATKNYPSTITVVSCACSDDTNRIVLEDYPTVGLVANNIRLGKSRAIAAFLKTCDDDILIITGADIELHPESIHHLTDPLLNDSRIGMVGGRIDPLTPPEGWLQRMHSSLWSMHHLVASRNPKLGEAIAVRLKVAQMMDPTIACDEVALELAAERQGLSLYYCQSTVARNYCPESLPSFFRQRKRIAAQHFHVTKKHGYRPATSDFNVVSRVFLRSGDLSATALLAILELFARLAGICEARKGIRYDFWSRQ